MSLTRETESLHAQLLDVIERARPARDPSPAMRQTIRFVEDYFGVSWQQMTSHSRSKTIAHARHVATYTLQRKFRPSLCELGRIMNRHHTTIMESIRVVERATLDIGPHAETIRAALSYVAEQEELNGPRKCIHTNQAPTANCAHRSVQDSRCG